MLLVEEHLSLLLEDLVDVAFVFALSLGVALEVGLAAGGLLGDLLGYRRLAGSLTA
jgi:hypothetical protein